MNHRASLSIALMCLVCPVAAHADPASVVVVPGEATDLSAGGVGGSPNRLGGFGSDLYYDRYQDVYYGVSDRALSPLNAFDTRVQQFTLDIDPNTGAASNFQLQKTIFFKTADGTANFSGLSAANLNGMGTILGLSLDPEGFVVAPNGNFFVSDEYGPSVYEFQPVQVGGSTEARFVRAFETPDNLLPRDADGVNFDTEFSDPPSSVLTGRQEGRGFESLSISPSGDKLFALFQSPLQEEGDSSGRYSRNLRLVEYDVALGTSTAQYIYQVESIDDINARIPDDCPVPPNAVDSCADFLANQQGRNIAPSAMLAVNDHQFLVVERDNRGIGTENANNEDIVSSHIGTKSIYRIDITGATDASGVSLAGTNDLPPGVVPVSKDLFLDLHAELNGAGLLTPEKFEGLAVGPQLASGQYALITITDNDNTALEIETDDGVFFLDVYANELTTLYTPLDDTSKSFAVADLEDPATNPDLGPLPDGFAKIPTYIYSFSLDLPNYQAPVPEPSTLLLTLVGFSLFWRQSKCNSADDNVI